MTGKMKRTRAGIMVTLLAVALSACAGPSQTAKPAEPTAALANSNLSGKVVETMDAGGYTYICLEKDGKKTWAALPVMKVSVGDEMNLLNGAEMSNFPSKALNRTFDKIIFSAGPAQPAGKPAEASKQEAANESAEPILVGKVVETMDAAQYTYINLEKDGKTAWSAVPATKVKVGDEIELLPGTAMGKFTSKRLNRTFNAIYFASGIKSGQENSATGAAKGDAGAASADPAAAQLPAGHPKIDAAAKSAAEVSPRAPEPAPTADAITGKVVETADAGGYTYICLEKDGKKTWAAVPPMKVSVGQELALSPGVVMTNFVSKSLNRTFEKITFSNGPAN